MSNLKKIRNKTRQNFLLTLFEKDGYQEKFINGFWLVKNFNGNSNEWQVSIYPEESFKKIKLNKYTQGQLNFARELETLKPEEIDYRTKLAMGMTDEEKQQEFIKWHESLEEKDKKDFDKAFGN